MVINQQLQPFTLNGGQHFRHDFVNKILQGEQRGFALPCVIFQHIRQLDFIDHTYQYIRLIRQFQAFRRGDCRGVNRQLAYGLFKRVADILHKGGATLLILLIQTLRLFKLLIHQHFPVLIANNKDLRAGSDLAAKQTDLIQFVINCRLNHALMLFRHAGNILQVKMRQQMIGDFIADHGAVAFLIVDQQTQRQQRNDLFINGA